jgi:hypothetical protein
MVGLPSAEPDKPKPSSAGARGNGSTGPRTAEGKATASRNGWKGGRRELLRELALLLKKQHETLSKAELDEAT